MKLESEKKKQIRAIEYFFNNQFSFSNANVKFYGHTKKKIEYIFLIT